MFSGFDLRAGPTGHRGSSRARSSHWLREPSRCGWTTRSKPKSRSARRGSSPSHPRNPHGRPRAPGVVVYLPHERARHCIPAAGHGRPSSLLRDGVLLVRAEARRRLGARRRRRCPAGKSRRWRRRRRLRRDELPRRTGLLQPQLRHLHAARRVLHAAAVRPASRGRRRRRRWRRRRRGRVPGRRRLPDLLGLLHGLRLSGARSRRSRSDLPGPRGAVPGRPVPRQGSDLRAGPLHRQRASRKSLISGSSAA